MSGLGGGAPRGAFRDGSSRFNSYNSRRRQSLGGGNSDGEMTPQKHRRGVLDSSGFRDGALSSSSRASSAPRRSLGGDSLRSETPIKDRRAMLAAWRQARAATQQGGEDNENRKRTRADPLLPPTASRKIPRANTFSQDSEDQHAPLSQNSTASYSVQYYDDESENSRAGSSLLSVRTPRGRRGKLGSARRHTLMGRNVVNNNDGKFK